MTRQLTARNSSRRESYPRDHSVKIVFECIARLEEKLRKTYGFIDAVSVDYTQSQRRFMNERLICKTDDPITIYLRPSMIFCDTGPFP